MENFDIYSNPLVERYSSKEMLYIFSPMNKFSTWRKLWVALAKAQQKLGLNISDEQLKELEDNIENIDFDRAAYYENKLRHDVMAHVHTYGEVAPNARGIIHLGATSAFVGDNTDIIVMRDALDLVAKKLALVIQNLSKFALEYKDLPTLGYTHFQPAQLTTVGKRACLWIQDLYIDLELLEFTRNALKLRGVKGTTGTQASFLELFENDHVKVKELDHIIASEFNFSASYSVTGQTYPRKVDANVVYVLSAIAQSLHKISTDLRLLQSLKEIEEPFEKSQIGSSAMAYKRNPMRSERISALSKFVISLSSTPQFVASTQWFERTLDDSANKRLAISQSFLAIDAALDIANNITNNLVVYPKVIEKHLKEELPFMATENIIMNCVKKGGDRQDLHERIRIHSMEAGKMVKQFGLKNDLIDRIVADESIGITKEEIDVSLDPKLFIGRSIEQVEEFTSEIKEKINNYTFGVESNVDLKV